MRFKKVLKIDFDELLKDFDTSGKFFQKTVRLKRLIFNSYGEELCIMLINGGINF